MTARVAITGRGTFLPADVLGNDDVAALADAGRLRAFVESNVWCRNRFAACRANGDATADVAALDRKVFAAFVGERVGILERRVVAWAATARRARRDGPRARRRRRPTTTPGSTTTSRSNDPVLTIPF